MEQSPTIFRNPRVLMSFAIALSIVVVAFFSSRPQSTEEMQGLVLRDAVLEDIHQDSDVDGLETWEENLWGTDSEKGDTDGDGTQDGEEVRVGRDPKKHGPNDRKEDIVIATTTRYYDDDPTLTTTDVISRDLYSGTAAMEKTGQLTDENVDALIGGLIDKAKGRMAPIPVPYTPKDIRVSATDDLNVYHVYFNGVATIVLEGTTSKVSEEEALTLWTAKTKAERRPTALKEIAREKDFADKLLLLTVPPELAKPHLGLINALSENVFILNQISTGGVVNPIEDLLMFQEFQSRMQSIIKDTETLFSSPVMTKIPWDPNKNEPMAKLSELNFTP